MTGLLAGLGLGLDYFGGEIATLAPGDWGKIGLVAFLVFAGLTIWRAIDLAFQQNPKAVVEVYPSFPVGRDISLTIHNKTRIPVLYSARITCETLSEPSGIKATSIMNATMGWEASGSYSQEIVPDGEALLKLCRIDTEGKVYWVSFYKVESNVIKLVRFIGHEKEIGIKVAIQLDANLQFKGQRDWIFRVSLIPASSCLSIIPELSNGRK